MIEGREEYIQKGHAQLPTKKSWCSIILLFRISTWSAAGERKKQQQRNSEKLIQLNFKSNSNIFTFSMCCPRGCH